MTSPSTIDSMLQDLDEILSRAHACLSDPVKLAEPLATLENFLDNRFAEMKTAIAEDGMNGDQRLHLASCMDRLVDLQAKTQARLHWFDTLGSDLAEMVERG